MKVNFYRKVFAPKGEILSSKSRVVFGRAFYFILSGEIMENISVINVVSIYSEMIWYHFTVY